MRSLAEAATQTPAAVISLSSFFSLSIVASLFIFPLTLFVIGALSSLHFQRLDTMETVHRNPIAFSFFPSFLSGAGDSLDDPAAADARPPAFQRQLRATATEALLRYLWLDVSVEWLDQSSVVFWRLDNWLR